MSLINQMLADLEARKGGSLRHVDSALDGLHAATGLPRATPEHLRLMFGGLLIVAAAAALWATREPLYALLKMRDVTPAPAVMSPPATPVVQAQAEIGLAPVVPGPLSELPSTPVVVLDAPPLDPPAPTLRATSAEADAAAGPTTVVVPSAPALPLEPAVPAVRAEPPPAVPVDLAPVYLAPDESEALEAPEEAAAPSVPRLAPLTGDPTIEYRGSFRREQSTTPAATPAARRYAEITSLFANGRRDAALSMLRSFVAAEPARDDARQRLRSS